MSEKLPRTRLFSEDDIEEDFDPKSLIGVNSVFCIVTVFDYIFNFIKNQFICDLTASKIRETPL